MSREKVTLPCLDIFKLQSGRGGSARSPLEVTDQEDDQGVCLDRKSEGTAGSR